MQKPDMHIETWLQKGREDRGPMGDHGAIMPSEMRALRSELPGQIRALGAELEGERIMVALVGAPGSGKSRLAAELVAALNAAEPGAAAILPMDGFHRDNDWLDARGLRPRKGAPETFDTEGLAACLSAVRAASADQPVPTFDRDADAVVPGGAVIAAGVRYVLVEGNYLLLTHPGWRDLFPLFDLSVRVHVPEDELRARLMRRWHDHGIDAAEALRRVEENDLPNGRLLRTDSRPADLVIGDFT